MRCSSCGVGRMELLPATAGVYYRPGQSRTRDTCCPMCAQGWQEYPAGAGYYPAGGDAVQVQRAGESDAAFQQRLQRQADAQRQTEAQAEQAARDREAALRGINAGLNTASTGISEGFATERARIEAESRLAQARATSQAEVERVRIEAARDLELARLRAQSPGNTNPPVYQPLPLETANPQQQPTITPREDSGGQKFPVKEVAIAGAIGVAIWLATRKNGGGRRRR